MRNISRLRQTSPPEAQQDDPNPSCRGLEPSCIEFGAGVCLPIQHRSHTGNARSSRGVCRRSDAGHVDPMRQAVAEILRICCGKRSAKRGQTNCQPRLKLAGAAGTSPTKSRQLTIYRCTRFSADLASIVAEDLCCRWALFQPNAIGCAFQ